MTQIRLVQRECGGCTACCTVNGIKELSKPVRTTCEHECEIGCAIYAERPQSCRDYNCAWVQGFGTLDDRPDKLGILIECRTGPPDREQLFIKEVRPGAAETPEAIETLKRLRLAALGLSIYLMDNEMNHLVAKFEAASWKPVEIALPECPCPECVKWRESTDDPVV